MNIYQNFCVTIYKVWSTICSNIMHENSIGKLFLYLDLKDPLVNSAPIFLLCITVVISNALLGTQPTVMSTKQFHLMQ